MTIVAVIAVLAGPSVLDCAKSPDGMATCLRDKVSDFGLLPRREAEGPTAEPAAEPEVVATTPGVPELTLLRAEPDGSVVIAGTAGTGARVAVYANGALFGTATAEPSGDWALVPDAPLPAGGSEITVREAEGAGGTGTRSFVVVIDPDKVAEPKVVATTPAQAQQVLEDLAAAEPAVAEPAEPEPAAQPEPAAAHPRPEEVFTIVAEVPRPLQVRATVAAAIGTEASASGSLAVAVPPAEVAVIDPFGIVPDVPRPLVVDARMAGAAGMTAAVSSDIQLPAVPVEVAAITPFGIVPEVPRPIGVDGRMEGAAGMMAAVSFDVLLPAVPVEVAAIDPFTIVPELPQSLVVDSRIAGATGTMAVVSMEASLPARPVEIADPFTIAPEIAAAEPPTIEAIEIDGRMSFFAGAGEESATVRLFIGDRLIGESEVEGERWLVEARDALTEPSQHVRVEMMLGGSQAVAATAEADVTVDLPDAAAAALPPPPHPHGIAAEVPPAALAPVEAPTAFSPDVSVIAASVDAAAGIAAAAPRFHVAMVAPEAEPLGGGKPAPASSPSIEVLETRRVPPTIVAVEEEAGSVITLPGAEGNGVPTIRAMPLGDPGAMRFASGRVIIRRGDTLWDIADRVYGDGYKYRTIYRANRDKIRRPGRIYPGQVFDIPLVYDDD